MQRLIVNVREVNPEIVSTLKDKYAAALFRLRSVLAEKHSVDISEFDEDVIDDYIIRCAKEHHIRFDDAMAVTFVLFSDEREFLNVNPPNHTDLFCRRGHKDIIKTPETPFDGNRDYLLLKVVMADYLIKEIKESM